MNAHVCKACAVAVPKDLAELDRFGVARPEDGRKIPYRYDGSRRASTTNPRDWGTLDQALETLASGRYSWLAWAFFEQDGFVGIDLDDCLTDDGNPRAWVQPILGRLAGDSYAERSPGGFGVKIWVRGKLPANLGAVKVGDGAIEMYSRARYFAMTCSAFRGAPLEVEDHADDVLALYNHLSRPRRVAAPALPAKIPHGQIHNKLVSLCGVLRAKGVHEIAIESCLMAVLEHQCEAPVDRTAVPKIIRSTRRWAI